MTYSPEPWAFDGYEQRIIDATHCEVGGLCGDCDDAYGMDYEDMRRIVACVNACRGIPIELLEQIVRERKCILYDVKNFGCCAGSTLVLDADRWAGNEDIFERLEKEEL